MIDRVIVDNALRIACSMKSKELRNYACQYLDEERIIDSALRTICEDCVDAVNEPDINCAYCPCDFDCTDERCSKWWQYEFYKRRIAFSDILTRFILGSYWSDEYID